MSKKNLLNESQIRQFMKLAQLDALAGNFVDTLTETNDVDESHGRGRGEGDAGYGHRDNNTRPRLEEDAHEEEELHATEDELGDMDAEDDRERDEIEDLEADDAGDGRTIAVADFLSALESALEGVLGDEVEIADTADADEVEADVEMDAADDLDDLDDLEERQKYGGNKGDERRSKRDYMEERQKYGGNKGDESRSKRDYMEEEKKQGADDREDEHLGAEDGKESGKKQSMKDRRKEMRGARRAAGEAGDPVPTQESVEATDELVEKITKRVAARILKSALKKRADVNEGVMGDMARVAKKGLARATGTSREEFLDDHFSKKIAPHLERILSTHASKPHDLAKLKSEYLANQADIADWSDQAWQSGTRDPEQEAYMMAHAHMQDAGDRAGLKSMYDNEGDRIEN